MADDTLPFKQVYVEHRPKIYRYLTRLVGIDEAEDLTQEVFIKVGQGLSDFDNRAGISTWIYRIATNVATDRLRSRSYRQNAAAIKASETGHYGSQACANEPLSTEDQLIRKEMNECIKAYVDYLPDNYRAVLVLSELEGFRNSEIAEILGLSVATVKIRLHRAREKLKKQLEANCTFYRTACNQLACEPKGPFRKRIKPLPQR